MYDAQDLPEWTLLGEYTGVWDRQDSLSQRINEDSMGLGVMRRDKVTALAYTSRDAPEDVQRGTPLLTCMLAHGLRVTDVGVPGVYSYIPIASIACAGHNRLLQDPL